jgi:hypothetical protein
MVFDILSKSITSNARLKSLETQLLLSKHAVFIVVGVCSSSDVAYTLLPSAFFFPGVADYESSLVAIKAAMSELISISTSIFMSQLPKLFPPLNWPCPELQREPGIPQMDWNSESNRIAICNRTEKLLSFDLEAYPKQGSLVLHSTDLRLVAEFKTI